MVAAVTTMTPWILEIMKFTVKALDIFNKRRYDASSLLLKSSKPKSYLKDSLMDRTEF